MMLNVHFNFLCKSRPDISTTNFTKILEEKLHFFSAQASLSMKNEVFAVLEKFIKYMYNESTVNKVF